MSSHSHRFTAPRGWRGAVVVVALLGAACTDGERSPGTAEVLSTDPYALADTRFSDAFFVKPTRTLEDSEAFVLAPLIVQSSSGAGDTLEKRLFGSVSFDGKTLRFAGSTATVYFDFSRVELHGRSRRQATYRWWYRDSSGGEPLAQGVRMTLDDAGKPALWEILHQSDGLRFVVAATWLEEAAAAEFGPPPPDRRFALERPAAVCPDVFVLRIIAPGPVPMGPFVYLGDPLSTPVTVLCRCMPSAFDALQGDGYYELEPMERLGVSPDVLDDVEPSRLPECLRLPTTF